MGTDRQTDTLVLAQAFETSKPTPSGTPVPTKPHFLTLSKHSINWEPDIKIYMSL